MPSLRMVPLGSIRIPDVRVSSILDDEQKALMASTVREVGVVQDIVVREVGESGYELVAGRSRLQALADQGALEIPVKVVAADERLGLILNIVENVARGTYEYISIAQAIRRLRSLGSTDEELERIFPWSRRWIVFIEGLQDLPDDVVCALRERRLTPTHVQVALSLPTPFEVHDGLKTALNLGWDTGTFRIFVQNRVDQIERLKREAEARGVEAEIPPAVPGDLVAYSQCLLCGYKKPRAQVTTQLVCEGCRDLAGYVTSQLGPPEDAVETLYAALKAYFGVRQPGGGAEPSKPGAPAQG